MDTTFPAFTQKNHVTEYNNVPGGLASPILEVTVNGQSVHGLFDSIKIVNDAAGHSGISVQTQGAAGVGFILNLSTTIKGVVRSDKIPKQVFPGNFQTRIFSYSVPPGVTYSGQIVV